MSRALALAALAAASFAAPAGAQTWTPTADSPRDVIAVTAEWPSGVQMAVRCTRGRDLDVMITLGRPVAQPHVAVTYAIGDVAATDARRWRLSEDGGALFIRTPTDLSRRLLHHEDLVIEVHPDEGPRHRYELNAPSGEAALHGVLTACRRPTSPPSQDGASQTDARWLARPTGAHLTRHYPRQAMESRTPGEATIECRVSARGELEDCIVLSESPEGMGFGAATLALAPRFRLTPIRLNGHAHAEAIIRIPVQWRMN